MTIVFRLPSSAAERVAFSYSPAMEAVLSLHGLWPEVRSDPGTGRFWLERPHDHEVGIGAALALHRTRGRDTVSSPADGRAPAAAARNLGAGVSVKGYSRV